MGKKVRVAGVGMIPFTKPGQSEDWDVMAEKAIRQALADAGVDYSMIQQAYAGYMYADSTAGQSAVYRVGITGIPIVNVNNNCSTGSTALYLARQMVELGGADCVLAVGFEQMIPGALGAVFNDRKATLEKHGRLQVDIQGFDPAAPPAAQQFGGAGMDYQAQYGIADDVFGRISVKARKHAANNPLALFRDQLTLDEVMQSKHLYGPLTRFQACPPTCGAAAAVLVSPEFAARHGLNASVEIKAQAMTTDYADTFDTRSMMKVVGYDMSKAAARQVYEAAGIGPEDIQTVELHDCFTANELITYEALGLCPEGGAEKYILDGDNTYGGKHVTNPSGGLLSKAAARQVYEAAGIGPEDIQTVELHDCFTANELITYEALGLCPEGGAEKYILDGDNTYGGRHVTNPSGGLLSKGHPLGATGLAQCYELTHQLRGTADARQVENLNYALQHNLGLGGACVVTLYGRA